MFLYTKTKGCVDEAIEERITVHNNALRQQQSVQHNYANEGKNESNNSKDDDDIKDKHAS